ncbi:MAG: prepilin-type N-terminal cleavage/methylation domain-containing protein [Planctomycetota bacterium]|jgi:prepilin-type N-terminal cleavage/methylation domain-containing protein/prepilin-type processing-associated H-X9-DG protein
MKRSNGFTLVELLVVIAIIALLMGILMPALARVRQIAYRLKCGTNLSGIGKAMLVYSNEFDGEFPRAGFSNSIWTATIPNWRNVTRDQAFNSGNAYGLSITSNFFMLIKYTDVTPASFLCTGDSDVREFKLSDTDLANTGADLMDCWDFGPKPQAHCSYSYHSPFGGYQLTNSSDPGMAVAGDPNPWLRSPSFKARPDDPDWNTFDPDGDRIGVRYGNAQTHQEDGQNVVYVDGHVTFEKNSACGVDGDNVFTKAIARGSKRKGARPVTGDAPLTKPDSLLLTDGTRGQ